MSSPTMCCSRRGFLRLSVAGAALAAVGRRGLAAERAKRRIPVGIQLYSVRGECKKDLPQTLEALAKMGCDGVEFAGYYGRDAKTLKKLLDDNGLKCCGTHTGIGSLLGDNLKKTVEFHKALDNRYLMVPSLPGKYRKDKQAWLDTAKLFSDIAAKAKPDGMVVGYHNHSVEFKPIDGETPWDIFFGAASAEVAMQLDTGNCMGGGGDPVHFLRKYIDRAHTIHLKEAGGGGVVGQGRVKWAEIFALCQAKPITQWYIIEFGGSPHGVFVPTLGAPLLWTAGQTVAALRAVRLSNQAFFAGYAPQSQADAQR